MFSRIFTNSLKSISLTFLPQSFCIDFMFKSSKTLFWSFFQIKTPNLCYLKSPKTNAKQKID
ncbi:hypothetical protein HMPREF1408_00001 [Helicobacter pylori GAM245Ai]|nr:hypothetical protein HMPREF1408_00001 [Helicobacter pylori GAM245Ai]